MKPIVCLPEAIRVVDWLAKLEQSGHIKWNWGKIFALFVTMGKLALELSLCKFGLFKKLLGIFEMFLWLIILASWIFLPFLYCKISIGFIKIVQREANVKKDFLTITTISLYKSPILCDLPFIFQYFISICRLSAKQLDHLLKCMPQFFRAHSRQILPRLFLADS